MSSSKALGVTGLVVAMLVGGCMARPEARLVETFETGELGSAREFMNGRVSSLKVVATGEKPDRDYVLEWMRTGMVTLADGYSLPGHSAWDRVYAILRTTETNAESTGVLAFLTTEELAKTWKGEPFEQAMAFVCIGSHYAMQGDWGSARAAFQNSEFSLKAIKEGNEEGKVRSTDEIITASEGKEEAAYFGDENLMTVDTDFALGYLLHGLAARQQAIGSGDPGTLLEADENFNKALKLNPNLKDLVARLKDVSSYNTILLVDYGRGPQKIGTGMDNVVASFKPLHDSCASPMLVKAGPQNGSFTHVCDLNVMAVDHRWNNLQDMRTAKSYLGTALIGAGAVTAAAGGSRDAAIAGLVMMGIGAAMKASAHADIRYCEIMPQRLYVVPMTVSAPNTTVTVEIEGKPAKLALAAMGPPAGRAAQFRYVRMLSGATPKPWAESGQVYFANEHAAAAGRVALPYILGGHCVRPPSSEAMARYQAAGFLRDMTAVQLEELYRLEKIRWTAQDSNGQAGRHVLEGGDSLLCPLPGTLGYARLFGQDRPPYSPKSKEVAALAAQLAVPPPAKQAAR